MITELFHNLYFSLFLIIALGLLLGKIKIAGISLDVSAIIFVALLFGHYGVTMPPLFQKLGLIFFIYSVGIQAGPGFFESFKKDGVKLLTLAFSTMVTGVAVTLLISWYLNIDMKLAVGLFAGALTSTPGLAAAIESSHSSLASIGYGVAYPFGVLGVIIFVKIAPKLFKISIPEEEKKYYQEVQSENAKLTTKNFVVENKNVFGKSLEDLKIRTMTHTNISRILHNGEAFTPTPKTKLHENDIIKAVGTEEDLKKVELLIGRETDTKIPLNKKYVITQVLVTNKDVVNKQLSELGLLERYNATATSIRRAGIDIIPDATTKLKFGDKVTIACSEQNLAAVKKLLGDNTKALTDLDFLPVSLGILIGILLGKISIPLFGLNLSLGLTGGVLLAAIILSRIGKTGSILWNVSGSSNQLLRKIGLIFFLVAVGTDAGSHLVDIIKSGGVVLLAASAAITISSMIVTMLVGHFILKINFLTLLGALTGSMTSTPALSAIEPMTESNAPKVAYAAIYPVALVLIIIFSQILATL